MFYGIFLKVEQKLHTRQKIEFFLYILNRIGHQEWSIEFYVAYKSKYNRIRQSL